MKAFKFKLHAILQLKAMAKNEALQAYVLAQQKRQALEEEAEGYKDNLYNVQKNIDTERQSLSVAHKNAYYLEVLDHERLKLKCVNQKILQAKKEEKEALQYYRILKQEEEIVKKLKCNLKKKHEHAALLAEQKDLEEMINQRAYNT